MMRATMSTAPPAAYGTTILIVLSGYAGVCAVALVVPHRRRTVRPERATRMSHMEAAARKKMMGIVEPLLATAARNTVSSGRPAREGERQVTAR